MAYGNPIKLRGSTFYATATMPTDSTASSLDGDFAFAADTQTFYQRKSGTWTAIGASVRGAMGMNGIEGSFFAGVGAPSSSTYSGTGQAVYIQSTGEVWLYQDENIGWVDSGNSIRGPAGMDGARGADGVAGQDGSQIYHGPGEPPANQVGRAGKDYWLDETAGILYVAQ